MGGADVTRIETNNWDGSDPTVRRLNPPIAPEDEAKLHLSLFSMIDAHDVFKGIDHYLESKKIKFTVDDTWASFSFVASDE